MDLNRTKIEKMTPEGRPAGIWKAGRRKKRAGCGFGASLQVRRYMFNTLRTPEHVLAARGGGSMGYRLFRRPPILSLSVIVVMLLCVWVVCVCRLWVSGFVHVCMCLRASVILCVNTFVYSCV